MRPAILDRHLFEPASAYAYPGLELWVNERVLGCCTEFVAQHLRSRLGARRTLQASARLSMVTKPAAELQPRHWFCHRDDEGLPSAETAQRIDNAQRLDGAAFHARWGIAPGYLALRPARSAPGCRRAAAATARARARRR